VPTLNGEPGVKSARYAGEGATAKDNIEKLLATLKNADNRDAFFLTIITLFLNGEMHQFEGRCNGKIIDAVCGENGFGYDPIFVPDGAQKTFAEMQLEEKNLYSHRKKAVAKLLNFLNVQ
jgi:XTP/dITP diphosphohydrolase